MKFVRQFALLALAVCSGLVVAGCEHKTIVAQQQPSLVSVAVGPQSATLVISGTLPLAVTGTLSDNSTLDLTSAASFSTDNPTVATVSGAGVVTAVNSQNVTTAGVAHILASANGKSGTATITVSPPSIVSIALAPKAASLLVGATQTLSVVARYNQGSTAALTSGVTFASDHTDVAMVDPATGKVTAVAAGTATITATHTATGDSDTSTITVTAGAPPTLLSVAVAAASSSLTVGGATTQLTVTGTYSSGPTQDLTASATFVPNTTGVVSITPAGVVTAIAPGTTTITATAGGKSGTSGTITVGAGVASYTILDFNTAGLTYKFDVFGTGADVTSTSSGVPPSAPAGGPAYVKFIRHPADACYSGATMWAETATTGNLESIGRIPLSNANSVVNAVIYVPVAAVKYRLKLEDASNNAHYVEIDVTPATTGWQTLAFDAKKFATATFDPTFTFNKLTLFPDFTCGVANPPADETLYVGPFTFTGAAGPSAPPLTFPPPLPTPSVNAPTPSLATHSAANVVSLYNSSATYTDPTPGPNYNAFGDSKTVAQFPIGAQQVWKYSQMNYQGWQFTTIDASSYTHLHVDVWTPDSTKFEVQLVNGPAAQTAGQVNFDGTTTPAITTSAWISLDIPLASFLAGSPAIGGFTSIYQLLFLDNVGGNGNGTFYIDNVYFWK
jgi:hypothetical protein